jgi:aspartyl/asparaginyl beta-hydroxylase (cupin superfamily)
LRRRNAGELPAIFDRDRRAAPIERELWYEAVVSVEATTQGKPSVSTTFSAALTDKERLVRIGKYALRRFLMPVFGFGLFIYFLPKTALFYALCGAYDVSRNSGLSATTLRRYFIGNGFFTWVLSPFNSLLDLFSLPHVNKGVYRLEDLPPAYRDEVTRLIKAANESNLVAQMEEASKQYPRTMAFFRWYGVDQNTFLNAPALRQPWQYIETIGISVFNKKVSTSKHFGYLRASLRILYNLNDMTDDSAYIVVGDQTNYWRENKLFIFDDTLLHQSFNETDQTRYCLFVDMIRPTPFPAVMRAVVGAVRLLTQSFKFVYYQNWKVIERP